METYVLMAIALVAFVGTIILFRFLIRDRDQALLIGFAAGLVVAFATSFAYITHLSACRTCIG